MRKHLTALFVILFLAVSGVWVFNTFYISKLKEGPSTVDTLEGLRIRGAPNLKLDDLSGANFELGSFSGKIVILNFWASWCAPCIEEVPSLIKLVKEFKGEIILVAISGDNSREDIEVFLKSFPELKSSNIKIVWDKDRAIMKQFEISRLPESMVFGKDQKLLKKIVGTIDWYNSDSVAYMRSLLTRE